MSARLQFSVLKLATIGLGVLWVGGCVTGVQLRDFMLTTSTRIFWQTIGTALQAAVIEAAGA